MKTVKLHCEILSPLHIGAGQEISPLDYIIKDNRMFKISFDKFVASMDEVKRAAFEKLIDKGNLIEIRKFVSENIKSDKDILYSTEVTPYIDKLYKSKINDIQNQLLIFPFIRTEEKTVPLIPGSSLKGAVRTAVISEIAKNSRLPKPRDTKEEYAFESLVLGYKDGKDDPFRGIKIRDKSLKRDDTIIREIKNVSKKKGGALETNNIQIVCEVIAFFM